MASAGLHSVHERAQFRIVLALDAISAVELIQPDLNFPNEGRAPQLPDVPALLNPLREHETVNRRELCRFSFEFFDSHARKLPRSLATATGKPCSCFFEAEMPRLEALNEPDDATGEVEELNGFFRRYALAA